MTDSVSPPPSYSPRPAWQIIREKLQLTKRIWQKVPFRHVLAATLFLFVVKEQYPFSDFPMYSHMDNESDVLYITDQTDRVLPMEKLFGTGASTQKKEFISELKAICNPKKRDTRDALPEERSQAGAELMKELFPRLKRHNLAKLENAESITGLRMYYKVFSINDDGVISSTTPQLVAERPL